MDQQASAASRGTLSEAEERKPKGLDWQRSDTWVPRVGLTTFPEFLAVSYLQAVSSGQLSARMSTADLEQLARWRTLGARHSEEVVELASSVLTSGRLGDQGASSLGILVIKEGTLTSVLSAYRMVYTRAASHCSPRHGADQARFRQSRSYPWERADIRDRSNSISSRNVSRSPHE